MEEVWRRRVVRDDMVMMIMEEEDGGIKKVPRWCSSGKLMVYSSELWMKGGGGYNSLLS